MAERDRLPQLSGELFITDGGMETTVIFHRGIDLPHFASFDLLATDEGRQVLRDYYGTYVSLARDRGVGLLLDTPTWRANRDWGELLGYSEDALARVNRDAVALVGALRTEDGPPIVVSGCVGPRGDGYQAATLMTAEEAQGYHAAQIETFAGTDAELVSALTLNYVEEAVGIARAADDAGIPVAISFTVETDGRLPTGQSLGEAIEQVDAETDGAPAYFMVNCAHPTHFADALVAGEPWLERLGGLRANASRKSHAELDESDSLDAGNPQELGGQYAELRSRLPRVTVVGGCCGTDERHIGAICDAWTDAGR
ncbi:MAG TPA: homocysteine S-methyltransferase family protein [Gaiellaceae bacterium]|nr:homocysteine S-methyltransferase family protein [Gaiellaceae bacterium]